jgi:hypothetical protein
MARHLGQRKELHTVEGARQRLAAHVPLPSAGQSAHFWARGCTTWPILPQHPHPSSLVYCVVCLRHTLPA